MLWILQSPPPGQIEPFDRVIEIGSAEEREVDPANACVGDQTLRESARKPGPEARSSYHFPANFCLKRTHICVFCDFAF
jgi:hypothetical protein